MSLLNINSIMCASNSWFDRFTRLSTMWITGIAIAGLSLSCLDTVPEDNSGISPVRILIVGHEYALNATVSEGVEQLKASYIDRGETVIVHALQEDQGFSNELAAWEIREWLESTRQEYRIESVLLIGDVPTFFYEGTSLVNRIIPTGSDWPYRVPLADFSDTDNNQLIDTVTGDTRALIPVGRAYANNGVTPGAPNSFQQVATFLERLAIRNTPSISNSSRTRGLNFIDSAFGWENGGPNPSMYMEELFNEDEDEYELIMDYDCENDVTSPATFWNATSQEDGWDLVHLYAHGNGDMHFWSLESYNDGSNQCRTVTPNDYDTYLRVSDNWRSENTINATSIFLSSCNVCPVGIWFEYEEHPTQSSSPMCAAMLNAHESVFVSVASSQGLDYGQDNFEDLFVALDHGLTWGAALNASWNANFEEGELKFDNQQLMAYNLIGSPDIVSEAGGDRSYQPVNGYLQEADITNTDDGVFTAMYGLDIDGQSGIIVMWDREESIDDVVTTFSIIFDFQLTDGSNQSIVLEPKTEQMGRSDSRWGFYFDNSMHPSLPSYDSVEFFVQANFVDGTSNATSTGCEIDSTSIQSCN